jgi:hypothetical protein
MQPNTITAARTTDPALSAVRLKALCRQLNDLLATAGQTDIAAVLLTTAEIKDHANEIRAWALQNPAID